jgi:hypothetical protein
MRQKVIRHSPEANDLSAAGPEEKTRQTQHGRSVACCVAIDQHLFLFAEQEPEPATRIDGWHTHTVWYSCSIPRWLVAEGKKSHTLTGYLQTRNETRPNQPKDKGWRAQQESSNRQISYIGPMLWTHSLPIGRQPIWVQVRVEVTSGNSRGIVGRCRSSSSDFAYFVP